MIFSDLKRSGAILGDTSLCRPEHLFPVVIQSSGTFEKSCEIIEGFLGGASCKEPMQETGDVRNASSIPGSGRFSGEGHGNLLQYSWLENPMDRGAWWATVHGVTKSQTGLRTKHVGLNIPEAHFLKNLSNCTSLLYRACRKCGRSSYCSWAHFRPWVKTWEQSVHGLCPSALLSGPKRSDKDSNVIKITAKI